MLGLLFVLSTALLAAETVPPAFNYQGRLTDETGQPLSSGEYTIAFRLWDDPTSTSTEDPNHLIWGRERSVAVVGGAFNVILDDSGSPVPGAALTAAAQAFSGPSRYLGLTVARTPTGSVPLPQRREVLPRQQLLSVPYALEAQRASSLISELADALCPTGTVIAWMGTNDVAPQGWEFCWGQEVPRTDPRYARLFGVLGISNGGGDGATTFRLPDLRGIFLRGVNGSRSDEFLDPDVTGRRVPSGESNRTNAVGSVQMDEFRSHHHGAHFSHGQYLAWGDLQYAISTPGNGFTPWNGGSETRPKNVYVHYLIKL